MTVSVETSPLTLYGLMKRLLEWGPIEKMKQDGNDPNAIGYDPDLLTHWFEFHNGQRPTNESITLMQQVGWVEECSFQKNAKYQILMGIRITERGRQAMDLMVQNDCDGELELPCS